MGDGAVSPARAEVTPLFFEDVGGRDGFFCSACGAMVEGGGNYLWSWEGPCLGRHGAFARGLSRYRFCPSCGRRAAWAARSSERQAQARRRGMAVVGAGAAARLPVDARRTLSDLGCVNVSPAGGFCCSACHARDPFGPCVRHGEWTADARGQTIHVRWTEGYAFCPACGRYVFDGPEVCPEEVEDARAALCRCGRLDDMMGAGWN